MSRGTVFMNPLHDFHKPRFPRSASCHSRSLSPQSRFRHRPFDALEVSSNAVQIQEIVGTGYFGHVYRGELLYERGNVEDFLREGDTMRGLDHPNVLRLLGICYNDGIPSLITPFMAYGDLRSYVGDPYRTVCVIEVVDFSQQISAGMSYLNSNGIVHRDLAARNCMLSENYVVKIADFGLAVDLSSGRDFGRREHRSDSPGAPLRLALKWLPVEVLRNRRCVHMSLDVWSFGVVIWELLARATPYEDLSNADLEWFLNNGNRLSRPLNCPTVLYDMMLSCWSPSPVARPRFPTLAKQLSAILNREIEHSRRHGRSSVFFNNLPFGNVNTSIRYS
ncbi:Protein kinase domain-containing protein [Aphelenchoides besseyi]|nr:Protein kinase domain-containing protein [Aphelenchoides besseyi]KAI6200740.1 Protein kinase domain-containing protein [Aphelenchoides besseyi]